MSNYETPFLVFQYSSIRILVGPYNILHICTIRVSRVDVHHFVFANLFVTHMLLFVGSDAGELHAGSGWYELRTDVMSAERRRVPASLHEASEEEI